MIRGFDASSAQGRIAFDALPKDLRFVILKAQEGNAGFDATFAPNMRSALAAGLHVFAYCFAYPLPPARDPHGPGFIAGRDPKEQARLCVSRVLAYPEMRGLPLFLDLEWPPPNQWAKWGCSAKQISAWCRDFAAEVAILSKAQPVLYTYPDYWRHVSAADVSWAARYALWLASYPGKGWPNEGDRPPVPPPWDDWLFWQFDGDGGLRLPSGDADFCVFNGGEDELAALRLPDTVPCMPANDIIRAELYPEPDDEPPPEAA